MNKSWAVLKHMNKMFNKTLKMQSFKTSLFSHQESLKSIFLYPEINGLKTFWHSFLKCCTTEAKAYSVSSKNLARIGSVCFLCEGRNWSGTLWMEHCLLQSTPMALAGQFLFYYRSYQHFRDREKGDDSAGTKLVGQAWRQSVDPHNPYKILTR